ncbi:MAG: MutS-related protein [Clostridium sp.]
MEKKSILFKDWIQKEKSINKVDEEVLVDLELDDLIKEFIRGYDDSFLEEIYKSPLKNKEEILYRQEIFKDLEREEVFESIEKFIQIINRVNKGIIRVNELDLEAQKGRRFLEVMEEYLIGIEELKKNLCKIELKSEGLRYIKEMINEYINDEKFKNLNQETKEIKKELTEIEYIIFIKGLKVSLVNFQSKEFEEYKERECDIKEIFRPFISEFKDYRDSFNEEIEMDSLEKRILELIKSENENVFIKLNAYAIKNKNFIDEKIKLFYKEVRFYISYLKFIKRFHKLKFNYPKISEEKEIFGEEVFSLSLANKNIYSKKEIIANDFLLRKDERIFIVCGPNSGGKTTFAKTFGQIHFLGSLGGKVQGRDCKLFLWKELFTHFGRGEKAIDLKSMLEKDIFKIKSILGKITKDSIVILNELFSSTAVDDGILLGGKVMKEIVKKDCICIYVTFIKELSEYPKTVSLVASMEKNKRTYKIERKKALGEVYAIDIVKKYGLDYESIKERVLND